MRCVIVSHTHWDREWYKSFQAFRARLIDTVDRVLDHAESDPDYRFQLDGQAIVIEDYLEIRPEREPVLRAAIAEGRVAVGPWYVQPDSLIPTGETHVRNLLEGRRVAQAMGRCSTVAYTPDSFGHPAQFPQMFSGFGLGPFVYWRGNADEIVELPSDYCWVSPDGSRMIACHLGKGYFPAWGFKADLEQNTTHLSQLAKDLHVASERDTVLLMNGLDHMLPDANTREVADALAEATGWTVDRGLLDDYVAELGPPCGPDVSADLPVWDGELIGGRVANLLPGVWSTHMKLKLANRHCETQLVGWAEPFAAMAWLLGVADERTSLRVAWRELLPNQAHDSICGCSQDVVHTQMASRYESIDELTRETTARVLDRLAGLGPERQSIDVGVDGSIAIAVFNPSPHARTDVVHLPLDGFPAYTSAGINPLLITNAHLHGGKGLEVDGVPARIIEHDGTVRAGLSTTQPVHDIEFVAHDVPALGWRRFTLRQCDPAESEIDEGRAIEAGDVAVRVQDDGRLCVRLGAREYPDLFGLEDLGDRGDTYDFDAVAGGAVAEHDLRVTRERHPSGVQALTVERTLSVPASLGEDRRTRSAAIVELKLTLEVRVAPGVPRVDVSVTVDNPAKDHRLRLLFPTGAPAPQCDAATTFDVARRSTAPRDGSHWIHPAPSTFPQQGFVHAGGLSVTAPGLLEAEMTPQGVLALTLLRATGWLSRHDLDSRPGVAGPTLQTPGAQVLGRMRAQISLHAGLDPAASMDAELGLRASAAGQHAPLPPATPLVQLEPAAVLLSTLKPAEDGEGVVVRLLNPTDAAETAHVTLAPEIASRLEAVESVRLDETGTGEPVAFDGHRVTLDIPPHALRTIRLRTQR